MRPEKPPISTLTDQNGRDVGVVYAVQLSYVVTATAPCTTEQLAGLVQDRIRAAKGVRADDVVSANIIEVSLL